MNKISILDMSEDLLDDDQSNLHSKSQVAKTGGAASRRSQPLRKSTLDGLVTEVASTLGVTSKELRDWTQEVLTPEGVLKSILATAKRLKLNPLLDQIDWEQNPEGSYEIYIPIDGWIAMIHREPSFKGLTFSQATETENGIPIWMECTIYRSDLIQPITVREYYAEVKTDHPIWQQMPRRMLRHKTLQQCARLAFGISAPELKRHCEPAIKKGVAVRHQSQMSFKHKELLRQKLSIK